MSRYLEGFSQHIQTVKTFIFGENNARLDYLIEYFYKLSHDRRAVIIVSAIATGAILFILTILLYLVGLFSLQGKLNSAYTNSNALKSLKAPYMAVQSNFEQIVSGLKSSNTNLSLISLLDQKAKDLGIQATGFPEKPIFTKFPSQSPFADQFQKAAVEFKLTNVSLKKMMEYQNSIEQLPNKLKVEKLRVISLTEAKLYFDVLLTVEGLIPLDKQNL